VVRVGGEPRLSGVDSKAEVVFRSDKDSKPVVPRFALTMYYLGKVPWHFVMFAIGIALAVFAIVLSILGGEGALQALMLGGFSILAGIMIMMVQNVRESRRSTTEPEQRIVQVYRQTPCPLDAASYERLVHSAKNLEDSIKEKSWEYDARSYQAHLKLAAAHFKQNRMRDAFREQCRAMLVLMDDVHRYRGKNEDFKPLW
jgi:hypothetical protein